LQRIVRRPQSAFGIVAVVVLLGALVAPRLGESMFPEFKERDFLMHWVSEPSTSHPEETRIVTLASKELRTIPGVRNFGSHIGQAFLGEEVVGINFGENWISVDPAADYDQTRGAIEAVVAGYPGLFKDVQTYLNERIEETLSGTGEAIVVRLYGPDQDVLRAKAEEVRQKMSAIPGVVDNNVELQVNVPRVQVTVDLAAAQRYALTPGDIRRAAATIMSGEEVGDIFHDNKAYDVMVWSAPDARHSLTDIQGLLLDTPAGGHVRLDHVADVQIAPEPNALVHENLSRRLDVTANVRGRDLGAVSGDVERAVNSVAMPLGYHAEILGEWAERQAAERQLFSFAIVAAVAVFLLLQTAFGNVRLAALVFLTLPSALVGGVLAAYASDRVISLGSLVGFFTILGIAARNGIMLISHYQHLEREEGEPFGPGLIVRGAQERLAPILMTALATGLALLPLVAAGSIPGHEIEHPMAVVILGGLATSTLLNLFIVPALYLKFGGRNGAPSWRSRWPARRAAA
ncbi:MAG TPA: efflux RND transporter permease subunit, partial [Thermomicrobiales bacterium]|nr:efflux RND transporter permease subunit [Thermomicrobiales bacterium]